MIEQQYYTRERGGLFQKTDGYDSIAKSPGLKLEFIKKNLHPLCQYDIPTTLQKNGESDESKYPPNFMILPIQTGELVVGQAAYKNKDFTGLRSTFFMHNYVLSGIEKRRYIKEPEKLFGITHFATSHNVNEGTELPTLAAIPYSVDNLWVKNKEGLLTALKMDEVLFDKLLYAIFKTVGSKKKIFIILDVELEQLGDYAKALLYHLYMELPWSIVEELGVCTYSKIAESKKNIQITFLTKEELRYDSKLEKEFIFDLANQKFLNVDFDTSHEVYFEIAHKYALTRPLWERFNNLAEQLLLGMKDKVDKSLSFYNYVATLFEMNLFYSMKKQYELGEDNQRKGLLSTLLGFVKLPISEEEKKELGVLTNYALSILERSLQQGQLFAPDEIDAFLAFRLEVFSDRENEEEALRLLLLLCQVALVENEESYIRELLGKTKKYQRVYRFLMADIYDNEEMKQGIAYPLIEDGFKKVNHLEQLMGKMKELEPIERILMTDDYYEGIILSRFKIVMENANNKVELLKRVQSWCKNYESRIYSKLVQTCEVYFLETIDLTTIQSEKSLCDIHFNRGYDNEKFEAIIGYQTLKTDLEAMSPDHIKLNRNIQTLIKQFYSQGVRKQDYYMLVYAFLEVQEKPTIGIKLNISEALNFLEPISIDTMLDFIIWIKGQEAYISKKSFDQSILLFFKRMKAKEGKWPKQQVKDKLGNNPKTKLLCNKLIKGLRPAFIQALSRHAKGLTITFIALILGISGLTIGLLLLEQPAPKTQIVYYIKHAPLPEEYQVGKTVLKWNREKLDQEMEQYEKKELEAAPSPSGEDEREAVTSSNEENDSENTSAQDQNDEEENEANLREEPNNESAADLDKADDKKDTADPNNIQE